MNIVDDQLVPSRAYARGLTHVLWDIENCMIPHGFDPTTVCSAIKGTLRDTGYTGPILITAVAAHASRVDEDTVDHLRNNHIHFEMLDDPAKQVSDNRIKKIMRNWTSRHHPPANILLISGDGGFARLLRSFENRGYNVMVAYIPSSVSARILARGTTHWEWAHLLGLDL